MPIIEYVYSERITHNAKEHEPVFIYVGQTDELIKVKVNQNYNLTQTLRDIYTGKAERVGNRYMLFDYSDNTFEVVATIET